LLLACAFAESDVIVLDNTNFETVISENEVVLVEFYAPWCGHCKKLEPEYEKAATELKGIASIAKINADEETNRPISGQYGIRGFPTLKLFRKGTPTDYTGDRSAQAIVAFMKKQTRPAVTTLTSADEVTKFSGEDKVVVVGFFESKESKEYKTFQEVAENLRQKFSFGEVVGNNELATSSGLSGNNGVVLFKKFDEGKNVLNGDQIDTLNEFITSNSVPTIDELGPETYKDYAESGLPLFYLFVDSRVEGQTTTYVDKVRELAKSTKGKLNFAYIDFSKYARHSESLGLSGKTVPAIAIEDLSGDGDHFAFDESTDITTESVTEWVNKFLNKELQPTIKSEPVPESNDGPVKVVVANNFNDLVNDPTKDVLLEFYAPWCGHCKKLVPTWEELGTHFKDTPSIVVAKVDATANDISKKLGVRGFPTIKLFPANNKESPIEYKGDRSLNDLIKFINDNASVKVESHTKDEL